MRNGELQIAILASATDDEFLVLMYKDPFSSYDQILISYPEAYAANCCMSEIVIGL